MTAKNDEPKFAKSASKEASKPRSNPAIPTFKKAVARASSLRRNRDNVIKRLARSSESQPLQDPPLAHSATSPQDGQSLFAQGCYVYGMRTNARLKIGISKDPISRAISIQGSNPSQVFIEWTVFSSRRNARRIEVLLQYRFKDRHIKGEWFAADISDQAHKMAKSLLMGDFSELAQVGIVVPSVSAHVQLRFWPD